MNTEAKLERILGAGWQTFTPQQLRARAFQLEAEANELGRVSAFAWMLVRAMESRDAPTLGAVLLARTNGDCPTQ